MPQTPLHLALAHLRRGDDYRPVDVRRGQVLCHREVFVRRPGRGVHDEVVHLAPVHVTEELLDHACGGGSGDARWLLSSDPTKAQLLTLTHSLSMRSVGGV